MPVELVKEGRTVAREKVECPECGSEIRVKFDADTKEVLWVHGASNPDRNGIIECYECKAKLKWTPP